MKVSSQLVSPAETEILATSNLAKIANILRFTVQSVWPNFWAGYQAFFVALPLGKNKLVFFELKLTKTET